MKMHFFFFFIKFPPSNPTEIDLENPKTNSKTPGFTKEERLISQIKKNYFNL
jgi:hypothetical protein